MRCFRTPCKLENSFKGIALNTANFLDKLVDRLIESFDNLHYFGFALFKQYTLLKISRSFITIGISLAVRFRTSGRIYFMGSIHILFVQFNPGEGNPIYYHGPHELCIVAGGPQNKLILSH